MEFIKNDKKIFLDIENFLNICILILLSIYLLSCFFSISLYQVKLSLYYDNLFVVSLFFAIFRFFILIKLKKVKLSDLIALCLIFSFLYYDYNVTGYEFLRFLAVFIIGLVQYSYKPILKTYLILGVYVILITIMGSISGGLDDTVYYSSISNGLINHSMGFVYTTDFSSLLVFLTLTEFAQANNKKNLSFAYLFDLTSIFIATFITHSRTSLICSIIILGLLFFQTIKDKFGHIVDNKKILKICKIITYIFTFFSIIWILILILYNLNPYFGSILNKILHKRVSLANDALLKYGIGFFGNFFEMRGNGGTTFKTNNYNFIDSSYPLILIRYGFIVFIIVNFIFIKINKSAIKNGLFNISLVLSVIAIHCISEHHCLDVAYNIFILLPFCDFKDDSSFFQKKGRRKFHFHKLSFILSSTIFCLLLLFGLPYFCSYLRTIIWIKGWSYKSYEGSQILILLYTFILLILIIMFSIVYLLFDSIIYQRKEREKLCILFSTGMLVFSLFFNYKIKHFLNYYYQFYVDEIKKNEEVINLIKTNKSGLLFSSYIPYYYNFYYGGFSSSVFTNDGLASKNNITIIENSDYESKIFYLKGFKWIQISDDTAVYTNDKAVVKVLTENGFSSYDFNGKIKKVDLSDMAFFNNITLTDPEYLHLDSQSDGLLKGPYLSLYYGLYNLHYSFKVDPFELSMLNLDKTKPLFYVKISAYNGDKELTRIPVYVSDFDVNGKFDLYTNFTSENYMGIEFLVINKLQFNLDILEIDYNKISNSIT